MPPYESDSSDDEDLDQKNYTETDVLLGYAEREPGNDTISRLGGRPDWLVEGEAPSAALARCSVCKSLMALLLQLNGELPDRFIGHERRLYVFACRNESCRRKPGSIRAVRGLRVTENAAASAAAASETAALKASEPKKEKKPAAAPLDTRLGETLFGVSSPFGLAGAAGAGANPFASFGSASASPAAPSNPFVIGGTKQAAILPTAEATDKKPQQRLQQDSSSSQGGDAGVKDLPRTFAETLSLNNSSEGGPKSAHATVQGPPPPLEPWPTSDDALPKPYALRWIADAEYETLDPTPALEALPRVTTDASMDVEDTPAGARGGSKDDKFVFESSMDSDFQKFADRLNQNPEQVIRYEFAGHPLLLSKTDPVGRLWHPHSGGGGHVSIASQVAAAGSAPLPRCSNCGARRVFEVQLMPHAIDNLEADELGLDGMDWYTVLVGVCEKDCVVRGTADGAACYVEEWVGVQWEELVTKRQ